MITFQARDGGWEAIPKPTRKEKKKKEKRAKKSLTVQEQLKRWAELIGEPSVAGTKIIGITIEGVKISESTSIEMVIHLSEEEAKGYGNLRK